MVALSSNRVHLEVTEFRCHCEIVGCLANDVKQWAYPIWKRYNGAELRIDLVHFGTWNSSIRIKIDYLKIIHRKRELK